LGYTPPRHAKQHGCAATDSVADTQRSAKALHNEPRARKPQACAPATHAATERGHSERRVEPVSTILDCHLDGVAIYLGDEPHRTTRRRMACCVLRHICDRTSQPTIGTQTPRSKIRINDHSASVRVAHPCGNVFQHIRDELPSVIVLLCRCVAADREDVVARRKQPRAFAIDGCTRRHASSWQICVRQSVSCQSDAREWPPKVMRDHADRLDLTTRHPICITPPDDPSPQRPPSNGDHRTRRKQQYPGT